MRMNSRRPPTPGICWISGSRSSGGFHPMLDISGYRATKRQELVELAARLIAQVKETGQKVSLDPMSSFERKVVHDAVTAAGMVSESEGVEPRRRVVILPS